MTTDDLVTVRTSERYALGRCQQRWWWAFREGLVPLGESADALWFGIGVHEALAQWYKKGKRRGLHPATYFERWAGDEIREIRASREEWEDLPKFEDALDLGVGMLENYVRTYGKDDSWDVISTEHPFKVKINRAGKPVAYFASRWDGVYRDLADRGKVKLMEHKTAAQIQTAYLELDPQGGAYFAVADSVLRAEGILGPKEHIQEITYNFLRKALPDDRPQTEGGAYLNKDGSVSKRQPAPYFVRHPVERTPAEARGELQAIADEVTLMAALRAGTLPILKNRTKDCPWCQFYDMCKLHQHGGRAWEEIRDAAYERVDPYADTRKSASA